MISIKNGKVLAALFLFITACSINAANLRVSKAEGPYTTIMAAITAAKPGDSVTIMDEEVYAEQVTIDSTKSGLVLRSENPTSKTRPTIKWQDKLAVNPTSCADAQDEAKSTEFEKAGTYFDQCGALRILKARGVIIDGIIVDGGGAYPFFNKSVWGGANCSAPMYDLFHGNAAIDLWIAGDITIRNCDVQNAYFGINIKDRNIRGIFASPNPSDIARQNIVPLSGFGKTGNHVFENNRIHNNSYGMFFESAWDLGSVIRYNLFYLNHHQTTAIATAVKGMGTEGPHQCGGAIMFKDVALSPTAIYNNTFWHNTMNVGGQWQAGASHLMFNNIFGGPITMWKDVTGFDNPFMFALDLALMNRTKHNLYAAMQEKPSTRSQNYNANAQDTALNKNVQVEKIVTGVDRVVIYNGLENVEKEGERVILKIPLSYDTVYRTINVDWTVQPGALILGAQTRPFPRDAENRWLEVKFKSTDPKSADFLVPDWEDSIMTKYIVDKGWEEAGIRDDDGSIADIGAIPFSPVQANKDLIFVKPTKPVIINGGTATVSFNLYAQAGTITDPVIKYVRWLKDLPRDTTGWGNNVNKGTVLNVTRPGTVVEVKAPNTPLQIGLNNLTFSVEQTGEYAFFEVVVEGKGSNGQTVTSAVGFLPYRKLQNVFSVKLYPPTGEMNASTELTKVQVGEAYRLQIIPLDVKGATLKSGEVKETELSMVSPYPLLDPDGKNIVITSVPLTGLAIPVMFTKIPDQRWDIITVNGIYLPAANESGRAIMGTSAQISINPGPPAKILFQDPPSGSWAHIYQGTPYDVTIQVYDKYDNKVNTKAKVLFESSRPETGDFVTKSAVESDTNGVVVNKMNASDDAELGDSIPIVGTLEVNGFKDNSKLVIGKPRNRYGIYYGDTALYNPSTVIPEATCSGTRVPVQIRVTTNNFDTLKDINNTFLIEFNSPQLAAFATDAESDTARITQSKLTNGIGKIYIQTVGAGSSIRDAAITISDAPGSVPKVQMKMRSGINFSSCVATIKKAEYSANNGKGAVDRLDIYYLKELKESEIPDSMELFWPTKSDTRKVVVKANMQIDPEDATHLIVTLPDAFPEDITASDVQDLGKSYWKNPSLVDQIVTDIKISDKVGPLIKKAVLIERLQAGLNDTLIVEFTEHVQGGKISGEAFQLTKGDGVKLNVDTILPMGNNTFRVVIENRGEENSPKEGDFLKIFVDESGESIVVDGEGNFAHKDNRPVELFIQEIPPTITFAAYYDKNADGQIDSIALTFNKKVKLGEQEYGLLVDDNKNPIAIASDAASYIADSQNVGINLSDKLSGVAKNRTSVSMVIKIDNKRYLVPVENRVADSAAPVILDTVWYYQGRLLEDETQAFDTLRVRFSEDLKNQDLESIQPFVFFTGSGEEYRMTLEKRSQSGAMVEFKVTKHAPDMLTATVANVTNGDRVIINVEDGRSSFFDNVGNSQKNQSNRKALLMVKEQPVNLSFKIGPSPLEVNGENSIKIFIQPKTTKDKKVDMVVKIIILDNLGNCVYKTDKNLVSDEKVEIGWNGTNLNGRLVGTGTYALYIESIDKVAKTVTKEKARKIAVKNVERKK